MNFALVLLTLAGLAGLAAWIWFVVVAFRNGETTWGILLCVSFVVPIGLFVIIPFLFLKWSLVRQPAILFLSSVAVSVLGLVLFFTAAKSALETMVQAQGFPSTGTEITFTTDDSEPGETAGPPPVERPPAPAPTRPPQPPPRRPSPPRPAAVASAGAAASSEESLQAAAAPPATDVRFTPVEVEVLNLSEPGTPQMRSIDLRARNAAPAAVHELKLGLTYLDSRGNRLGRWTTVHEGSPVLVEPRATNQFAVQAFFVPQSTRAVQVEVIAVGFVDGHRWPPVSLPPVPVVSPSPAPDNPPQG